MRRRRRPSPPAVAASDVPLRPSGLVVGWKRPGGLLPPLGCFEGVSRGAETDSPAAVPLSHSSDAPLRVDRVASSEVRRGLRARRPRLNSCSVPFQETPKEAWVDHMGRLFWAASSFGRFVQTQRTSRVDGRSSLIFSGTCTRRSFAPSGSNGTEEFCTEDPLANQIACKKHRRPLSDTGCGRKNPELRLLACISMAEESRRRKLCPGSRRAA
jgi:hypothetical protein